MHLRPNESSLYHFFVVAVAFAIGTRDIGFLLVHAIDYDTEVVRIDLGPSSGSVVLQPLQPDFIEMIFPPLTDVLDLLICGGHQVLAKLQTLLALGDRLVLDDLHVAKPLIGCPNLLKPWPRFLPVCAGELLASIVNALFPVLTPFGVRQVDKRFVRIFIPKFLTTMTANSKMSDQHKLTLEGIFYMTTI